MKLMRKADKVSSKSSGEQKMEHNFNYGKIYHDKIAVWQSTTSNYIQGDILNREGLLTT